MDVLTKLASQESSRLEKIAAAISAVEEGYNPEEVVAFAAEQGIHPDEIEMGLNLFGEASLEKEAAEQEQFLNKIASVAQDPNELPLVKVAAAIDLFAADVVSPEEVYEFGAANGFDQKDVDFIFGNAYPELAKEAKEETPKKKSELMDKLKALGGGIKDAATLKDIREGLGKTKDWGRVAKGAGKSGALYGIPAAAGGYLAYKSTHKDDDKK